MWEHIYVGVNKFPTRVIAGNALDSWVVIPELKLESS